MASLRRNAWREVHESMHGGMYLKEALEKVQNNSLFWMREVYERVISERAKGKSKKGKDKKGSWGLPHPPTALGEERKGPWRQRWQRKREREVKTSAISSVCSGGKAGGPPAQVHRTNHRKSQGLPSSS